MSAIDELRQAIIRIDEAYLPSESGDVVPLSTAIAIVTRLEQENARLRTDLEQGFMQGAYARLKNLQEAEQQVATLTAALEKARGVIGNIAMAIHSAPFADPKAWGQIQAELTQYMNDAALGEPHEVKQ